MSYWHRVRVRDRMHVHVSPQQAFVTWLYVLVFMGLANLVAMKFKEKNSLAASYCNLFGLD